VLACALSEATAAPVRGGLALDPEPLEIGSAPPLHSATQLQVAQPAPGFRSRIPEYALFLRVEDSLPLPDPEVAPVFRLRGFELVPHVASCPVDVVVTIVNETQRTLDLGIDGMPLGPVAPGAQTEWVCETGAEGAASKTISVDQHPFMTASIYVGEVGVAGVPDAEGRFELSAPAGTYELLVVAEEGIVARRDVRVADDPVDLGLIRPNEAAP